MSTTNNDSVEEFSKRTLELDNLDGVVLFAHAEDLEVAEDGLLGLRVPVDLDAEEVALVLPVEFALQQDAFASAHTHVPIH